MNMKEKKLHIYFFIIAIITGFILLNITPPMCVPDENTHFLNTYAVSEGQFYSKINDGKYGKFIPENIINFSDIYNNKFRGIDGEKYTYKEYYLNSNLKIKDDFNNKFISYWGQDGNPISYLIGAIGINVGKILLPKGLETPFNLLLFARMFNLIFYIVIIYFSIKMVPYYKNTIFLLSLMPMSIFLGASLSYDAILIPICFLLFSYILKLRVEKTIKKKDVAIISAIVVILFSIKLAYAPLILALLSIPVENFGDKKRYLKIVAFISFISLISLAFNSTFSFFSSSNNRDVILQKDYLKNNLGIIFPLIFNSFKTYMLFYIQGFFGILGQLDVNFPIPVFIAYMLIFLYTIIIDGININIDLNKMKILNIVAIFIFICGVYTSMYINWTPIVEAKYGHTVSGIQGRYFIPLIPFTSIMLSNKYLENNLLIKGKQSLSNIVIVTSILYCTITVFAVFAKYWL